MEKASEINNDNALQPLSAKTTMDCAFNFVALPREIQRMIWIELANLPRIMTVYTKRAKDFKHELIATASHQPPVWINQESRTLALNIYRLAFGQHPYVATNSRPAYFNSRSDTLYIINMKHFLWSHFLSEFRTIKHPVRYLAVNITTLNNAEIHSTGFVICLASAVHMFLPSLQELIIVGTPRVAKELLPAIEKRLSIHNTIDGTEGRIPALLSMTSGEFEERSL